MNPYKPTSRLAALAMCGLLVALTQGLPVSASRKLTAASGPSARVFMDTLPLNISITTPVELATEGNAFMSWRQAITVVFSRPVIALGSDFNSDLAMRKVPFKLSCSIPGKTRWVTTTIARFDPDVDWPTDLNCSLRWNTNLKTFDGARLQLGDIPAVRQLVSSGLAMYRGGVSSETAQNLTGGQWSAFSGAPGDKLPEVPPDGRVSVLFSYPVNLQLVQAALQLLEGTQDTGVQPGPSLPFTVRPCYSPAPWLLEDAASLDVNDTCAEVEVGPALKKDTWYTLRLPNGSRYHPLAGPLGGNLDVTFAGLRPFRLPMLVSIADVAKGYVAQMPFRRWTMWLPHGLAPGVTAARLAAAVRVCALAGKGGSCTSVPFTLSLPALATARLTVPSAAPGETYRVYISASAAVKDGFGQGLQASSTQVTKSYVQYDFAPPSISGNVLAVLESGVDGLTEWPYVTRAPPPGAPYWPASGYTRTVASYSVDLNQHDDVIGLLAVANGVGSWQQPSLGAFGAPAARVTVPAALTTPGSGADWAEVRLPLGGAKVQVVYGCCTPQYNQYKESVTQVVLRTSISVSVVQAGPTLVAWVTDASLAGGAAGTAVGGANVSFYGLPYDNRAPYLAASCTTDATGVCSVGVAPIAGQQAWDRLGAVVKAPPAAGSAGAAAGARYAVLPYSGFVAQASPPEKYVATLVVDRMVVVPGDSLKITGFVQMASPSGLSRPSSGYAVLQVDPSWGNGGSGVIPRVLVKVNGTTGTFHGEIHVPADAQMQVYSVSAYIAPPSLKSAPALTSDQLLDGAAFVASLTFVVSSPRPPTAELLVAVTPWVLPSGSFVVNTTAVSYLGAAVGGSTITLTWRHATAAGVVSVLTDAAGFATATVDLGALPEANRTTAYDTVAISVEWIGPTRERITQSASVNIADGPAQLSVQLSAAAELPGTSFALAATLTSSADGSALPGVPVTATLRPNPAAPGGATCATSASIATTSGAPVSPSSPRLTLPCIGHFLLEACADVAAVRVCTNMTLGRNTTEWAAAPLAGFSPPTMSLDKPGGYLAGDSPVLSFESAFSHSRLLLVWGNDYGVRTQVVSQLPAGTLAEVTFGPLGDECLGGCGLVAVLDVPRLAAGDRPLLPPTSQLPWSRVFDPRAPHSHTLQLSLTVAPLNSLAVAVAVSAAGGTSVQDAGGGEVLAIEPGASAQIAVAVDATPADGPVEVTVYVVDKAFLDLMPYDLPHPEQQMLLRINYYLSPYGIDAFRIAPGAIRAVYDKLMARLTQLDPWLPVDTAVQQTSSIDTPDDEYLAQYETAITYMAGQWYGRPDYLWDRGSSVGIGRPMQPSARSPSSLVDDAENTDGSADGSTDSSAGSAAAPAVRVADAFVVTPLFTTAMVGADGTARVTFAAPQNLGAFVVRAYAAAGKAAKYGSGEGKLVVRRELSLTASVPRFVRVGDTFEAGVVVTVGSAPATVTVTLQIGDAADSPVSPTGPVVKSYTFTAGGDLQEEVRFSFSAVAVGSASLTFSASDGAAGGAKDALQLEIPVEGQQGDVWVATSFALAANDSASSGPVQWQEGMELPGAVPGSGGLMLTAGVGYYPAIAAVYDNLALADAYRVDAYAPPALLWSTLPAVLSYYGKALSGDQSTAFQRGLADLTTLTNSAVGLLYAIWDNWYPSRTDLFLNTRALFVVNLHAAALQPLPTSPLPPLMAGSAAGWVALKGGLAGSWGGAIARQVVADAVQARSYNYTYSDWNTLAWTRLVLGATWQPQSTPTIDADLSLATLLGACSSNSSSWECSLETRVVLSLVLLRMGSSNPAPALVATTVNTVSSALRVQGRTAYVAAGTGSSNAAPLGTQALSLLLLLRAGARHPLVPKLAAYTANPTATSGRFFYYCAPQTDQALAVAALSEYDRSRGSAQPRVNLTADANGLTVLQASFRVGKTQPVSNTTAWEDLPAPPQAGKPGELSFEVVGTGEVTVAASLHFVPSALLTFPTYRGIYVEATLQLVDPLTGGPTGRGVSAVPLGSVVLYTVQLTSPDDLGAVTLSVMMPGGLEPLDPNLVADAGSSCLTSWIDSYSFSRFYRWWWWPMCPSRETRPSVVTFSYASLAAGTTTATIKAVAASVGRFVVPPVRASADQQPELMGATAAKSLTVCATCTGPTYASAAPVPKACPDNCGDNGLCNLKTGACSCDAGFGGPDCSRPVA